MLFRSVLAGFALATVATYSEADPYRWLPQPAYPPVYQPVYQPAPQPVYQTPIVLPASPVGATVISPTPVVTASAGPVAGYTPVVTAGYAPADGSGGDGLDEVNAKRAARGLRPFLRDEGLAQAARSCAQFRAARGLAGHTSNDFAFVPAGTFARSAGCAASEASWGWMSCCVYENFTYAGAAWVTGRDGRRYMHLFVR
jgi:uncharacterized protein YkwD